jgi:competence protein ComEC
MDILTIILIFLLSIGAVICPPDCRPPPPPIQPDLQVIVFDVGQADCTLLKMDDHAMLIDAGNLNQDTLVLSYLAEYNVTSLDYLVATHPHSDHIGSMPAVIYAMESIGAVIMPNKSHTTGAYENLIKAIDEKNIPVTIPEPGDVFQWGAASVTVLAPNSPTYRNDDLNEYSIVLRVEFGEVSFLFTGDAGEISESEQLDRGFLLKSDVLKVGHHGSRGSSTQQYLDAVAPSYAVICCGANNSYGHPTPEALGRLAGAGAEIYRTDQNGTITFKTNGTTIDITTAPPPPQPLEYIGNKNSLVFHLSTCTSLPSEANRVYFDTREDAIEAGYRPCGNCKP